MQRESIGQVSDFQTAIIKELKKNNIEVVPHNIIKYTCDTILELKKDDCIPILYSVILIYKDFIIEEFSIIKLILEQIETCYQDKVLRILKYIILNNQMSINLFSKLIDIFYKSKNTKLKNILSLYENKNKFINQISDIEEYMKFFNLFFDDLIKKVDFKSKLGKISSRLKYKILDNYVNFILEGKKDHLCIESINKMLSINKRISEGKDEKDGNVLDKNINNISNINKEALFQSINTELIKDKWKELNYVIQELNKLTEVDEDKILKILIKICKENNLEFIKNKIQNIELKENFISRILEGSNTKLRIEFFFSNRALLIPNLISVIREINDLDVLQNIASMVDPLLLKELLTSISALDFIYILKGSYNNDISTFLSLYNKDSRMIQVMPYFLSYCTDIENNISSLINVMISHIQDNYYLICFTIKNIIHSHTLNRDTKLILRNEISKETSINILSLITKYEIFEILIKYYKSSGEVNDLLFTISEMCNFNINDKDVTNIKDINNLDINLDLYKFYIPHISENIEFISKILEGCKGSNQKKYYEILYYMEKYKKISWSLYDTMYSEEIKDNLSICSTKWRMKYLYLCIQKSNTRKDIKDSNNIGDTRNNNTSNTNILNISTSNINYKQFIYELITSIYKGNKKAIETCQDIMDDMMNHTCLIEYIQEGLQTSDLDMISGSFITFSYLMSKHMDKISSNNLKYVYDKILYFYKSINTLIIIKCIRKYITLCPNMVTQEVMDIIEWCIDSRKKKYRKDIKDIIRLILDKNILQVNRQVKQYYKFKIKTDTKEVLLK